MQLQKYNRLILFYGTSFNEFRQACNEEILITVVGNTLTMIAGAKGARALGDVHKEVEEAINKADMRFIEKVLNTYFVPMLEARGFKVAGGKFVFPTSVEPLKVDEIISLSDIIDIPTWWIYDKYGIPSPKKGEPLARKKDSSPAPEGGDKEKEKNASPNGGSREGAKLADDRNFFLKLLDKVFPYAPTMWSGATMTFGARWKRSITGTITLADKYAIDIDALINQALREIYGNKGAELVNKKLFDITNNALQHGISPALETVKDDNFVRSFKENTAVFAAYKNHQQTKAIAALMVDADGNLVPFYKFKKEALKISEDYNVNWLRTEYNTAVRAADMAANMKEYERTAYLYPNLEYMRTNASHPRAEHLDYVGTILPIGHEWWRTHLPPSDWNCDCSVKPTKKEATAVPEDAGNENPVFANNPAETAEFVKIEKTAYYKHTVADQRADVAAEGIRLQKIYQKVTDKHRAEVTETYKGKKGGFLEIVPQNRNERDKNLTTYKMMADNGGNYTLLPESKIEGVKNPDAFNFKTGMFSDAKHPQTINGQRAIQNSISNAADQMVGEVIIRLTRDYPSSTIYNGLKAALQPGLATDLKSIILIRNGEKPIYLNVKKLRARFSRNKNRKQP
jgi:hypothetical protein